MTSEQKHSAEGFIWQYLMREGTTEVDKCAVLVGSKIALCAAQTAYAVSPIKLLATADPLYSWRQRMLKAYDSPHTAHGQKGFPESLE